MADFIQISSAILASGGILLWLSKLVIERTLANVLRLDAHKVELVRGSDLEHRKAQIRDLYGPLYGLLKTNRKIYDLWMAKELDEVNLKIKRLFKENNQKAVGLIIDHAHLIDESPMPEMFIKFVTSSYVWSMYCADSEEGEIPEKLSEHPDIKWCQEFEDYVFKKYEEISLELSRLYDKHGITGSNQSR